MTTRRHLEQLAIASLTEEACPPAEQLAAYTLGMLSGTEQLQVAAHVRSCPICTQDVAISRPPIPRSHSFIARLLPLALTGHSARGNEGKASVRRYEAADLNIEFTTSAPDGDYWRITGQVLRAGAGVTDVVVILRAGRKRLQQISDDNGFFTFDAVPAGTYTLTVTDGRIHVDVRDLRLITDDE